jgi:hypothetical protein
LLAQSRMDSSTLRQRARDVYSAFFAVLVRGSEPCHVFFIVTSGTFHLMAGSPSVLRLLRPRFFAPLVCNRSLLSFERGVQVGRRGVAVAAPSDLTEARRLVLLVSACALAAGLTAVSKDTAFAEFQIQESQVEMRMKSSLDPSLTLRAASLCSHSTLLYRSGRQQPDKLWTWFGLWLARRIRLRQALGRGR